MLPAAAHADAGTRAALRALRAHDAADRRDQRRASIAYDRAVAAVERLHGERKRELRGAIADVDAIASRGMLNASRLRTVTLTLDHNRRWWTRRPMLPEGARVHFGRSELLWQRYRGHGLQLQWLATFSKANSLWRQHMHKRLRRLLHQAMALAVPRGPGIAWEYMFSYAGGRPPWVSGLAQGTALSALTRAARALHAPRYRAAAHAALGIFRVAPPIGVRIAMPRGTHFLQYSDNPRLRVLNGFVQALNGLSDLARSAKGPTMARWLLERGDRQALAELRAYVTGGWSRYSSGGRLSNVHYQRVLRDFVRGRCDRGGNRGYCRFATRLTRQLMKAPVVRLASSRRRLRQARVTWLRVAVDKPAAVTVTIVGKRFREVDRISYPRRQGRTIRWRPPRAGPYTAHVTAVDLAGNRRSRATVLHVLR